MRYRIFQCWLDHIQYLIERGLNGVNMVLSFYYIIIYELFAFFFFFLICLPPLIGRELN